MVVTSGWYGLGHMTPVSAVIKELRKISDARISLFTLPFEVPRLRRLGEDHLFDAIYVGAGGEATTDYLEYVINHYYENRICFHHAFYQEQPDVLIFHWMMLIEVIDVACLSRCRVVGLLEETEWGYVVPGSPKARYFPFIDEVIFCDNLQLDRGGLHPHQYRVGCITEFATARPVAADTAPIAARFGLPAGLPLILVNTAGGTYRRTHRYVRQVLSVAERRSDLAFLVMIGPMCPDELCDQVQAKSQILPNLMTVSDPSREEVKRLVSAADLSVHSGGISSTAECLALHKKFLVVNPVGSDHENDACRVQRLAQEGLCLLIETADEDEEDNTLSQAIDNALSSTPPLDQVPTDGAVQVASLLKEWLGNPAKKAVSDRSALVCFFAPDVDVSMRLQAKEICPDDWHYLAIDLPASAVDCSLSLDLEVNRVHRLIASLRSYKETLFVAVVGADPKYDRLLHQLLLSHEILFISTRSPSLEPRFVSEAVKTSLSFPIDEIQSLLGRDARCYRVKPPIPEHEDYVEPQFSPFHNLR